LRKRTASSAEPPPGITEDYILDTIASIDPQFQYIDSHMSKMRGVIVVDMHGPVSTNITELVDRLRNVFPGVTLETTLRNDKVLQYTFTIPSHRQTLTGTARALAKHKLRGSSWYNILLRGVLCIIIIAVLYAVSPNLRMFSEWQEEQYGPQN